MHQHYMIAYTGTLPRELGLSSPFKGYGNPYPLLVRQATSSYQNSSILEKVVRINV